MKQFLKISFVISGSILFSMCAAQKTDSIGGSSLFRLSTDSKEPIPGANTSAAICQWIKTNGYFPSNSYQAGTKVLYSLSYGTVDNAAGQAYGTIGSDGNLVQQGLTTMQLVLCPGGSMRNVEGKCNWQFNGPTGYAQLAMDTVCNARDRSGGAISPGYSQISASHLTSYKASTAGMTINGGEAVQVDLSSRTTTTQFVFAKNIGLVAVVFKEKDMPGGTAEVFIGAGQDLSRVGGR